MKINKLIANNLKQLTCQIEKDSSLGIVGLSGSGKSTFCLTIADETLKRIVTLLPKSEYRFLFSEKLFSNYSAQAIESLKKYQNFSLFIIQLCGVQNVKEGEQLLRKNALNV